MSKLLCATGNETKFNIGKQQLAHYGIDLEQVTFDVDEIQSEDIEKIICDKAQKAFNVTQQPVVVTDDSWSIPGLNGFPGPYMKSINHWFTPDDFIRLTKDLEDRRIYLNQLVAYQDEHETVVFRSDIPGTLLKEARGNFGVAAQKVVSLEGDEDLTISEIFDQGKDKGTARFNRRADAWNELGKWLQERAS